VRFLISAQFNISPFHGQKSNHHVAMSYHCCLTVGLYML